MAPATNHTRPCRHATRFPLPASAQSPCVSPLSLLAGCCVLWSNRLRVRYSSFCALKAERGKEACIERPQTRVGTRPHHSTSSRSLRWYTFTNSCTTSTYRNTVLPNPHPLSITLQSDDNDRVVARMLRASEQSRDLRPGLSVPGRASACDPTPQTAGTSATLLNACGLFSLFNRVQHGSLHTPASTKASRFTTPAPSLVT
jgi:hypothetical protein